MKKTTVFIVEDHKLIREMWSHFFKNHEKVEMVGSSGDVNEAVELVKMKRPDIILLDINMTPINGFEALPLLKKYSPISKIIAVSMHNQPAYAKRMFILGAMGYMTKNSTNEEIHLAIEQVINGKKYICNEVKDIISEQVIDFEENLHDLNSLTMREIEIINFIKRGLSSKQIAGEMSIAFKTVEVHRHNILKKLNLSNTVSLINFIVKQGL